MLQELSQRIFSDEKLCGADLAAKNDLRMLMRGANKGKIPSKSLYRDKYLSLFLQNSDLAPKNKIFNIDGRGK